jgi:hypothetical protein
VVDTGQFSNLMRVKGGISDWDMYVKMSGNASQTDAVISPSLAKLIAREDCNNNNNNNV